MESQKDEKVTKNCINGERKEWNEKESSLAYVFGVKCGNDT